MSNFLTIPCTTFSGTRCIARGALIDVALKVKARSTEEQHIVLTFNDASGAVIDLDLRGTTAEIVTRLTKRGEQVEGAATTRGEIDSATSRSRGRPKLGVVAREVTLLPRHWEWLAKQPGGASQVLRRLVEAARRADGGQTDQRATHARAYTFLSALAGDLPGYEDTIRALFAGDDDAFQERMVTWPPDIRDYALKLARSNVVEEQS